MQNKIRSLIYNNKKVIENYFFMTVLQLLNSLFYLLIYPFLIRKLGVDSYGLYVFAMSIVTYFIFFVGYGFDLLAVKSIAQNVESKSEIQHTLSCVFTAKIYLEIISIIIFCFLILIFPIFRDNWIIFFLCFLQTFSGIFFPQWYFQGVQKMRTVTGIQLFFKLFSLPFIFLLINNETDLWIFVLISTIVSLSGAITAAIIVRFNEKLIIKLVNSSDVLQWYRNGLPFFLSNISGILKEQSVAVMIGVFFGMREVAIYDLANKIIMVPRTLLISVNGALFPKLITNIQNTLIKKVVQVEYIIGILVVIFITIFGKFIVSLMGGIDMAASYPIAVILSFTVLVWLVVGAYVNFVFIPLNKNFYVTKNQIIALVSFFTYTVIGFLFSNSIMVLVVAITLSGITEILFCKYIITKNRFL